MILVQVETWPAPLLKYLASRHNVLLAYACHERKTVDAYDDPENDLSMDSMPSNPYFGSHEDATLKVVELLQSTTLRGWHCTRLTENEVEHITMHGMQPPNLQVLQDRIRRVQADNLLSDEIAQRLIDENQADHSNRKDMISFCFYEPRIAGQSGIERFFRHWGGEALYGSHEHDIHTGEALRLIGRPCLIEADVPISSIGPITFLGQNVIRRYLLDYGYDTGEPLRHEDKSREPIPAANIVRFVFHGEPEFATLSGCDSWRQPLDS